MKRRIRPHGPLFFSDPVRNGWFNVYAFHEPQGVDTYYVSTLHHSIEWASKGIRAGVGPSYRIRVKVKPEYKAWLEEDRRKAHERQAVIDQYELEKAALRRERRERRKQTSAVDAIADAMMPTLPKAGG